MNGYCLQISFLPELLNQSHDFLQRQRPVVNRHLVNDPVEERILLTDEKEVVFSQLAVTAGCRLGTFQLPVEIKPQRPILNTIRQRTIKILFLLKQWKNLF